MKAAHGNLLQLQDIQGRVEFVTKGSVRIIIEESAVSEFDVPPAHDAPEYRRPRKIHAHKPIAQLDIHLDADGNYGTYALLLLLSHDHDESSGPSLFRRIADALGIWCDSFELMVSRSKDGVIFVEGTPNRPVL